MQQRCMQDIENGPLNRDLGQYNTDIVLLHTPPVPDVLIANMACQFKSHQVLVRVQTRHNIVLGAALHQATAQQSMTLLSSPDAHWIAHRTE